MTAPPLRLYKRLRAQTGVMTNRRDVWWVPAAEQTGRFPYKAGGWVSTFRGGTFTVSRGFWTWLESGFNVYFVYVHVLTRFPTKDPKKHNTVGMHFWRTTWCRDMPRCESMFLPILVYSSSEFLFIIYLFFQYTVGLVRKSSNLWTTWDLQNENMAFQEKYFTLTWNRTLSV